jgi:hypothetical protein
MLLEHLTVSRRIREFRGTQFECHGSRVTSVITKYFYVTIPVANANHVSLKLQ